VRITILQGPFLPVPPILGGAVEKLWFQLGQNFASYGHSVFQISRAHPSLPYREHINGVLHQRIDSFNMSSNFFLSKLYDLIYCLRAFKSLPQADILISNTFWMPILLRFFPPTRGLIVISVERMPKGQMFLYKHVACLRCCSSAVYRRVLKEVPSIAEKIYFISNPLPFVPDIHRYPVKQKVILYTGRIHPEKGIELLLSAFSLACKGGMDGWTLRIVGPHETSQGGGGSEWYSLIRRRSLSLLGTVEWVGPIFDQPELLAHYKAASVFVYPSLAEEGEASPIAPLEAMSYGAVPIVSSLACFQDYIKHYQNGLLFNHRASNPVSELASTLQLLTSNPNLLSSLSASSSLVGETHHPSVISQDMLRLFRNLVTCPS